MRQHYVAVVHKEADSVFRAHFPDLPDVVATGPTLDEAIKKAGQALALNAKRTLADAWPLPKPSSLSQILADPAYSERRHRNHALLITNPFRN
jgi:predicted RNase H-like HicB family nuclease